MGPSGSYKAGFDGRGRKGIPGGEKSTSQLGLGLLLVGQQQGADFWQVSKVSKEGTPLWGWNVWARKQFLFEDPLIPKVTGWKHHNVQQLSGSQQSTIGPIPAQTASLK